MTFNTTYVLYQSRNL